MLRLSLVTSGVESDAVLFVVAGVAGGNKELSGLRLLVLLRRLVLFEQVGVLGGARGARPRVDEFEEAVDEH